MPRYVKDEINFHKFLNGMRQLHEATLEQLCEGYRRSYVLAETLYNNLWNEQERAAGQDQSEDMKNEEIIRDCILLSKYNKAEKEIMFFENILNT